MTKPNTEFTSENISLELHRFPSNSQHKSLQAWDSADEYLISHVSSLPVQENRHLLVLNDEFGALACSLNQYSMHWQNDSYIAWRACQDNFQRNNLDINKLTFLDSLQPLPKADLVLLKIPKSAALLSYQLAQIRLSATTNTQIIAAGKVTQVTSQVLATFEKYLGPCHTSLARKKSRLIFCDNTIAPVLGIPTPNHWTVEDSGLSLLNHANVFSRGSLDIGARFMLEHLPDCNNKHVVDLGCGNGVLGLSILHQQQPKSVEFIDESWMAVQSAQENVLYNVPDKMELASFSWQDCLEKCQHKPDIVICNPPFHQQNTITDHIAWQMFSDAKRMLGKGGQLIIVGNRHLDYPAKLKRLFGGYNVVASNRKFSILSSVKR